MFDGMLETGHVSAEHEPDWERAHREPPSIAKQRGLLDFQEALCIRAAQQTRVHKRLGYGSFLEYLERCLGYALRLAQEKMRVAEALEWLPAMTDLLAAGR